MRRDELTGPEALRAMQDLAVRLFPVTRYRHVGELAWVWGRAGGASGERPVAVWSDGGGRVVAWAWLGLSSGLLWQVDPDVPELADEVLGWAEATAAGRPGVDVSGTEEHLAAALRRRAWQPATDGFLVAMERTLSGLPEVPALPAGYVLRTQREYGDVEGRVAAHGAAFGSTRMTAAGLVRVMGTRPYHPDFDLVVVSPRGEAVAYCQGWYDEVNGVGALEPVGTRPEHRGRGLARAVCVAVLHAFARAGGRCAVVCCRGDAGYPVPRRLYASVGFVPYTRVLTYRVGA